MSQSLQTGQFFGKARGRVESGGVVLTEVIHASGRKLPRHTHESAYFGLLVDGGYTEWCTRRAVEYKPFTLGFHPAALTHSDEVGVCGSRMFCIELRDSFMERIRTFLTAPQFVPDLCASETTWLGLRLYRSFLRGTLDGFEIDELCAEMLERVGGVLESEETGRPQWLGRAVELLQESYRTSVTLEAIAKEVGVHPIHLSRVFRRRQRCTLAEYLNRLRVQFACRKIADGWPDLAELASSAGFADQSHMGRVFKACTGQTPGQFRAFFHTNRPAL
jgi:AraC family transcriptional regulator